MLSPNALAQKASVTVSADRAREVLVSMGFDVPRAVFNVADADLLIRNTGRLTPSQVRQFIGLIGG